MTVVPSGFGSGGGDVLLVEQTTSSERHDSFDLMARLKIRKIP